MRFRGPWAALAMAFTVAVAGCIDGLADERDPSHDADPPPAGDPPPGGASSGGGPSGDGSSGANGSAPPPSPPEAPEPESEMTYVQGVFRTWNKPELLVVVLPPTYGQPTDLPPQDNTFTRATLDSIAHWQETIREHAAEDLRDIIHFDVRVLGRDTLTQAEANRIDILVTHGPRTVVLGGMAMTQGPRCTAINLAHPLDQYEWMFMVSGHEFGHCLGLDHPQDHHPWMDIMTYDHETKPDGAAPPRLHCASNLNILGIDQSFGPAVGRSAQGRVALDDVDYVIYECWDRFLPS